MHRTAIEDIPERDGVSLKTVSRVIDNGAGGAADARGRPDAPPHLGTFTESS